MEIKDEETLFVGVDCQNDFIAGALPNPRAQAKVQAICEKIRNHKGVLIMTHDTHFTKEQVKTNWPPASGVAYEESLEGSKDGHGIPVHCIKLTEGYQIQKDILAACQSLNEEGKPARFFAIDKYTFGWDGWKDYLKFFKFKKIVIFGFVAGICVDSQATIFRALYPNIPIEVDAACTAGFTEEDEKAAYLVMRMKQIDVVNE